MLSIYVMETIKESPSCKDPYRSHNDFRLKVNFIQKPEHFMTIYLLQWREETFLGYLDEGEASVMSCEGFRPAQRKTMLLSQET